MTQVGITGLTPDAEPSAGQLADVTEFVEKHDVKTIYFETLVSSAVADAVASEANVKTDVLDPIEGLNDASQGDDYLEIMRANLRNLQAGQPCP
jgi:zinc transport system substrate-binding protein